MTDEITGGFSLLSQRREKIDIKELETNYEIELPPKYRLFAEYFELSEIEIPQISIGNNEKMVFGYDFIKEGIFNEKDYKKALGYPNGGIGFERFKPLKDSFSHWNASENWVIEGLLPIGFCGDNGILLGYKKINYDQIFFESRFIVGRNIKLAESIFEFVCHIKVFPIEDWGNRISFKKLYRNWGEKNWRIKEKK